MKKKRYMNQAMVDIVYKNQDRRTNLEPKPLVRPPVSPKAQPDSPGQSDRPDRDQHDFADGQHRGGGSGDGGGGGAVTVAVAAGAGGAATDQDLMNRRSVAFLLLCHVCSFLSLNDPFLIFEGLFPTFDRFFFNEVS